MTTFEDEHGEKPPGFKPYKHWRSIDSLSARIDDLTESIMKLHEKEEAEYDAVPDKDTKPARSKQALMDSLHDACNRLEQAPAELQQARSIAECALDFRPGWQRFSILDEDDID
jgi:hypothetical protein